MKTFPLFLSCITLGCAMAGCGGEQTAESCYHLTECFVNFSLDECNSWHDDALADSLFDAHACRRCLAVTECADIEDGSCDDACEHFVEIQSETDPESSSSSYSGGSGYSPLDTYVDSGCLSSGSPACDSIGYW